MSEIRKDMENNYLSFESEEDARKRIIALLLGGVDNPINSKVNFQKELFLLIQSFPKIGQLFNFMPHKLGPYSNEADYILENYPDLFESSKAGIYLTDRGIRFHISSLKQIKPENLKILEDVIKNIRSIYDKLNDREFMFLIYMTFGYTEKSDVFDKLMKDREKLAKGLFRKGVITRQRYYELIG